MQAAGSQNPDSTFSLLLNIGTPDASGDLTFLDFPSTNPCGDSSKLIHIADGLSGSPSTLFTVLSMDSARKPVRRLGDQPETATVPLCGQVFVSASSAASGWTKWSAPVQVERRIDGYRRCRQRFSMDQGGRRRPRRRCVVWLELKRRPQQPVRQVWNVYMSQVVYATDSTGAVTGAAPSATLVKVSPHPMHYNDVCLAGTGCIAQQGNRNLADFFAITIDHTGAAEIVYDDTSNGLAQPGFTPTGNQTVDHAGAGVITVARQSSGPGLFGTNVSGHPTRQQRDHRQLRRCALPSHWRQERSRNGHPEQLHQSVGQHLDGNDESRGSFQSTRDCNSDTQRSISSVRYPLADGQHHLLRGDGEHCIEQPDLFRGKGTER